MTEERGVRCPSCDCPHSSVVRTSRLLGKIRRRRLCRHCGRHFTTAEQVPRPTREQKSADVRFFDEDD